MPAGMTRELEGTASSSGDEEEEKNTQRRACIQWTGGARKIPILIFHAEAILTKESTIRGIGERYHLAYKIVRTDSRLVRRILGAHGFQEALQNSNDFNLMWTGSHLKPHLMRSFQEYQKVNHFPKSFELTRKDRLYKNVHRMQQSYGSKNFHFLPQTFMLPTEYQDFCTAFAKDRGPWIVKPVASSRGRGVYLINSPTQISLEENILVSRYISQPLLIDDFKFDVRLYVLVTSFDPLVIYLYEEGLTRFATVRYNGAAKNIKNQFMHLTNYSVNKKSGDYVSCDDPEVEDYGNKWSMSAMLRCLKQDGKDTAALMARVEDLIIKTIISGEMAIATACKSFVPHRGVCFELYGFDVLIDANLKPWLLEVNLSPSLACDAPLDLKVKASMLSDMFSLVGLVCHDPTQRPGRNATLDAAKRTQLQKSQPQRPLSASDAEIKVLTSSTREMMGKQFGSVLNLTMDEIRALRKVTEEWQRRGGFIRIFPRVDTWELYGSYLEYKTTLNYMLATHLFTERGSKPAAVGVSKARLMGHGSISNSTAVKLHAALYERKLLSLEVRKRRRRHGKTGSARVQRTGSSKPTAAPLKVGLENEEEEEEVEEDDEIKESPCVPTVPPEPGRTAQSVLAGETASQSKTRKEAQRKSSPEPPPINLMKILQDNGNLSKVQARMAFSAYLQRVRKRLNTEFVDQDKNFAWASKENEQMDLVVRFLKQAASNLKHSLRMELPGRRLPVADRRRILAYQLGEFIHHYNLETDHMIQKKLITVPNESVEEGVNHQEFQTFIKFASENELEEVLTFYTQKNKSASVFLGTNPRTTKTSKSSNDALSKDQEEKLDPLKERYGREGCVAQARAMEPGADVAKAVRSNKTSAAVNEESRAPYSRLPSTAASGISGQRAGISLESSHSSTYESSLPSGQQLPLVSALPPGPGPFTGNTLVQMPSSTSSSSPGQTVAPSGNWAYPNTASASTPERLQRSRSGIMTATSVSSLHCAAQIYSQRLSRPSSAKAVGCMQSASRHLTTAGASFNDHEDSSSQIVASAHHAVTKALQRLVEKQASRQYMASSHLGLLTQQLTNLNLGSGALSRFSGPHSMAHRPSIANGGPVRVRHSDTQEDSFHPPPGLRAPQSDRLCWDGQVESSAYSVVTGVPPQQRYQPTAGSYQLQYAMQQLELQRHQSRARHQTVFINQQLPSSSQAPVPETSSAQWTANLPLSHPKVGTQKAALGQSSVHHVPKPPVSHKQVLLRKTPSQRTAKVSVDGRLDGFQIGIRSNAGSTESIGSATGALDAPEVIFARSKPDALISTTAKREPGMKRELHCRQGERPDAKLCKEQIMPTNQRGTSPAPRNEVQQETHMPAPGQRIEFLALKRK